jgi:hypothetical protein
LTSVPHPSFSLRFSDLAEIEIACKEGEDQRAARTIEWIGARITKRCAKWVEDVEKSETRDVQRSPWWDELRRCTEGDHVPSKSEGWNHPVAGTSPCFLSIIGGPCFTLSNSHPSCLYGSPEPASSACCTSFETIRLPTVGRPYLSTI